MKPEEIKIARVTVNHEFSGEDGTMYRVEYTTPERKTPFVKHFLAKDELDAYKRFIKWSAEFYAT
jgi:hypothetical protein